MIDTVTVKFPGLSLSRGQLREWTENPLLRPDGKNFYKFFINTELDKGIPVELTYYPANHVYKQDILLVQLSLPKVLFLSNVRMVVDEAQVSAACRKANALLASKTWAPPARVDEGILVRIDLCANHRVGERVIEYIQALSFLTYPQRKTVPYLYEGVQYRSKVATTKFYDKLKECRRKSATGILRQETTLRKTFYLERLMGVSNPRVVDVRRDWVCKVLSKDLERLHADKLITSRDLALGILVRKYGWRAGERLYGHLVARQAMTPEQMVAKGMKARSIQRADRMIAEAGISLAMTEKVSLPPLEIAMSFT